MGSLLEARYGLQVPVILCAASRGVAPSILTILASAGSAEPLSFCGFCARLLFCCVCAKSSEELRGGPIQPGGNVNVQQRPVEVVARSALFVAAAGGYSEEVIVIWVQMGSAIAAFTY
jgi:hypothetical protein